MSNDRELLENAAKAAGIEHEGWVEDYDDGRGGTGPGLLTWSPTTGVYVWNPLTDDGDAQRLAVKLGLDVRNGLYTDMVFVDCFGIDAVEIEYGDDPYAATRRAIVRAAAEIGKGMK